MHTRSLLLVVTIVAAFLTAGCAGMAPKRPLPEGVEAFSLLGKPLLPPPLEPDVEQSRLENYEAAKARYEANPGDLNAAIWYGRRTAYLGRYRDAVAIYNAALSKHPGNAKLLRHRGHRYITLRQFPDAVADLEKAARATQGKPDEVEPDGLPNAKNQPTGTLQSNIWYHLGLARFLLADYEGALEAYRQCMKVSRNPDMLCATSYWLYLTLKRLHRDDTAFSVLGPIHKDMNIIENFAYHNLLLIYKEERAPSPVFEDEINDAIEIATAGFGVANQYLFEGDRKHAFEILEAVLRGKQWAAFGYIAAEADVARSRNDPDAP